MHQVDRPPRLSVLVKLAVDLAALLLVAFNADTILKFFS